MPDHTLNIHSCNSGPAATGTHEVLASDNGPAFTSSDFKEFMQRYDMKHITYYLDLLSELSRSSEEDDWPTGVENSSLSH